MTTAHDTAAALESAIRTFGVCAYSPSEPSDPYGIAGAHIWIEIEDYAAPLKAAITAHVEAEVARRLAPNLELWRWKCHDETIEQAIERLVRERNEYAEKLCERNAALVMAPDVEVAIVDYAHAAQSDFDTHEEREALRAAIAADKARAVEAEATRRDAEIFGLRAPARPTPDEARRLVEEFEQACDAFQYREADARTTARAALIAALVGKDP